MRAADWLLLAGVLVICLPLHSNTASNDSLRQKSRPSRASNTRTYQPGFLFLLGQFVGQTFFDTNQAVRNVTKIFNDQFTTTTPSPDAITEDGANSTETPPAPITRQQLFKILGNNYRGLTRLFNQEWQAAVEQSSKNVVAFGKELRESVRPFFFPNRNLTGNQNT